MMHLKWNCVWEVVKVKLFSDKIYKFARFFVNIPETNKQKELLPYGKLQFNRVCKI